MPDTSFNAFIIRSKFDAKEVKEVGKLTRTQENSTSKDISYNLFNYILAFLTLLNFNL
jgi:hypothetical protein